MNRLLSRCFHATFAKRNGRVSAGTIMSSSWLNMDHTIVDEDGFVDTFIGPVDRQVSGIDGQGGIRMNTVIAGCNLETASVYRQAVIGMQRIICRINGKCSTVRVRSMPAFQTLCAGSRISTGCIACSAWIAPVTLNRTGAINTALHPS